MMTKSELIDAAWAALRKSKEQPHAESTIQDLICTDLNWILDMLHGIDDDDPISYLEAATEELIGQELTEAIHFYGITTYRSYRDAP